MRKTTLIRGIHIRGMLVAATLLLMAIAGRSVFGAASASVLLVKEVSVDGGQTYDAYPDINNPVQAHVGVPVKFRLVITNTGTETLYPYTVDDCINFNPLAAPFACAPLDAGGQGAPGLVLYEPPIAWPSNDPLPAGATIVFSEVELPNLSVDTSVLCEGRAGQVVRNDAEADTVDGFNNRVSWDAFAYIRCPTPGLTVNKTPKMGTFTQGSQVSFTIVVGNETGAPATNAHLHDQLPSNGGLSWQTATASQGSCSISATNVLDCDFGTLPAGGSVTVTVQSTQTTPFEACQLQPNPVALATADGGLQAQDSGSMSCTPPPLPCPAGSFSFSIDANGNLRIVFDQFPAPNDNSYGVNAVGWPNGHTFNNLVGSDHAGFQLRDPGGIVRLSFNIDYISANTTAPSGYASLGPFGGDGKVLIGTLTPADIAYTSSLANNLNNVNIPGLFNAAHVQQFGSVNVLVNSPPTDPQHQTYANSDPALAGWDFHDTYFVTISAAKLAAIGFNSSWKVEPNLDALHNSPAKPCPPPNPGGPSLSVTKQEVKDKQVKVTILNSGSSDEFVTALQLSWPAVNGKLMQVKLDGDVIYDNPDIAPPSANLTLAQLVADANKRKIKAGESDVLTLIFEKNASTALSDYTGTLNTSGFSLTILP
jgi:uncharacterized repeat protein (TIGR01451 family)